FDSIRAVEPAFQRRDFKDYLRRIKGKVPKLRRVAELFAREFRRVSDHTNYQMASQSLSGCVRELEEVLAPVAKGEPEPGPGNGAAASSTRWGPPAGRVTMLAGTCPVEGGCREHRSRFLSRRERSRLALPGPVARQRIGPGK